MFSFIRLNKTWHNNYPPLPHRLQEVRLAKLTFPHLRRTRNKKIQKNNDHRTPLRRNYLLSEQTQSPLDTLSFEDMFSAISESFVCVKSRKFERGRLGICWFQVSSCLGVSKIEPKWRGLSNNVRRKVPRVHPICNYHTSQFISLRE